MALKIKETDIDLDSLLEGETLQERVFAFDVHEKKAFAKLADKQFNNPLNAFRELIANAIDSYNGNLDQARIDITIDENTFSIADYGSGLDDEKITLLRTLGLTDKKDNSFIGRFGIGFASLFDPELRVNKVIVDTNSEQGRKQLEFIVHERGKNVSLDVYSVEHPLDCSTRITIDYCSNNYLTEKILDKIMYVTQYLPFTSIINTVSRKAFVPRIRDHQPIKKINRDGVSGYIALDPGNKSALVILVNHHLPVKPIEFGKIFTHKEGRLTLSVSMEGVLNYDKFNLVSSRNEIQEDDQQKQFAQIVYEETENLLLDVFEEYKKHFSSTMRTEILSLMESNSHQFSGMLSRTKNYKARIEQSPLLKQLANIGVFEAWGCGQLYSLEELAAARRRQKSVLIATDKQEHIDILRNSNYEGLVVNTSSLRDDCYGTYKSTAYSLVYGILNADLLSRQGWRLQDTLNRLLDKGAIDPSKILRGYCLLNEQDRNVSAFMDSLRSIFNSDYTQEIFKRHNISPEISICYGRTDNTNVVALYDPVHKRVLINGDNRRVQTYLKGSPHRSARAFIPVLGHAVSHDVYIGHKNPFNDNKNVLTKELRQAVARANS